MEELYLTSETTYDDGLVEELRTYEYDANGNLIKTIETEDKNYDGIDEIITKTYAYDDSGNLIEETSYYDGAIDDDFWTKTYTYDANDNLIKTIETEYRNAEKGDGIVDEIITTIYTYDDNDNLIEETREGDENGDGILDGGETKTYTYDDDGNLIEETETNEYVDNGDVIVDENEVTTYTYDDNGNLIEETRASIDDNGLIGDPDSIISYTYDSDGNKLSQTGTNGVYTYTYDDNGNVIERTYDANNDGSDISTFTYTYDDNGNGTSTTIDYDGDGVIEWKRTSTYDENGNETSLSYYSYSGENLNYANSETYVYDTNGNLIEEIRDHGIDGTVDDRIVYTYATVEELESEEVEQPNPTPGESEPEEVDEPTTIVEELESEEVDEPNPTPGESEPQQIEESDLLLSEMHRFFEYEKGFHLYTTDAEEIEEIKEKSAAGELPYTYEKQAYTVLADDRTLTGEIIEGAKPVYSFFNTDTDAYLLTMEENERDYIQNNLDNYEYEGVDFYAFETEPESLETIPMYRMLNNSSGTHLFSVDTNEISTIQANLSHFSMENNGDAVFYVVEL